MAEALATYWHLIGAGIRSQTEYRVSFALSCLSDALAQATELVAILVLFSQVDELGGFDRSQVLLMYSLAGVSFGLAELVAGPLNSLPRSVRRGDFDTVLMRPLSPLMQLIAGDLRLGRLGRIAVGAGVFGYVLRTLDIHWTATRVLLAGTAPIAGAMIISSIWVASAAVSFWLVDGQEFVNSLTYGTNLVTSYPLTVFPRSLRSLLVFVIPIAFVGYYPTLALVGRPDPLGAPRLLYWIGPVFAVASALLAGWLWRTALRRYRSTGS